MFWLKYYITCVPPLLQGAALWPQGTKAQKEQRNILDSVLTLSIDTVKLSDNRSIFIPFFIAPLATLLHAFLCCPQVAPIAHRATDVY